tara:strand:- start:209 stop:406 length:198 start_codon:yes stop_codon:yes gene_type:complete
MRALHASSCAARPARAASDAAVTAAAAAVSVAAHAARKASVTSCRTTDIAVPADAARTHGATAVL